jgi:phenylacetate-CoA ligase
MVKRDSSLYLQHFRHPEIETLPRSEIEALQLDRLRDTLQAVYTRVPFYRARLDLELVLSGLTSLDGLRAIPFTTKQDIWDQSPVGLVAVAQEDVVRVHGSSGTRGRPTLVAYTKRDIQAWAAMMTRSLAAAGVRPGMRLQNAYGYGLFTGGLGFHYGAEMVPTTVIPMSGGNTARQVQMLAALQPEVLCCTPSFALHIADAVEAAGVRDRLALKIGVFGAEPWTEAMRQQIEQRLGLAAFDHYGLSEMTGPGVAQECPERAGLHVWEDCFLPEVVDPDTGEPVADGGEGELVLTTLQKEAMPLVRYRTGDLTALTREACECGRTHARIRRILGRRDDMLIIRGVNLFPMEVERVLLAMEGILPFYELLVTRAGALDHLAIQAECAPAIWENEPVRDALADRIRRAVRDEIGLTADVVLVGPGTLPRSEGKALRVIDRRGG